MIKSKPVQQELIPTNTYLQGIFEAIGTPRALSASILLKYNEIDQMLSLEARPSDYLEAYMYLSDAQVTASFRKNPAIGSTVDLEAVAVEKYFRAEAKCKDTNDYLRGRMYVGSTNLAGYLYSAKNFIHRILGSVPTILEPDFGPGASSACRGFEATIVHKLSTQPECTLLARSLVVESIRVLLPAYAVSCGISDTYFEPINTESIPLVAGNTFTTVPKDSRSRRGICVEPHGNILTQKGAGNFIRKRLKRAGWDLNHLPLLHKEYARMGSIDGSFATIDLSSASDTISIELVRELLPPEWFDFLNRIRSHKTRINGEWLKCEKFSSMGNGFTFELETLIFLSLCHAVKLERGRKEDIISVFGDDIIVPTYLAHNVIDLLKECGFDTNTEKTFVDGPFRESCGFDFFSGVPVRPTYIKEVSRNVTEASYTIANRIREIAYNLGHNSLCDKRFKRIWDMVVRTIPYELRCFGPASFGSSRCTFRSIEVPFGQLNMDSLNDQVIACEYKPSFKCRKGWSFRVSYLARITRNRVIPPSNGRIQLACALYGVPSVGVSPRGCSYTVVKRHTTSCIWSSSDLAWSN